MARRTYKRDNIGRFAKKSGANANRAGESSKQRSTRLKANSKAQAKLNSKTKARKKKARARKVKRFNKALVAGGLAYAAGAAIGVGSFIGVSGTAALGSYALQERRKKVARRRSLYNY